MRVAAVAGVRVGDDERPEVHLGRGPALLLGHPRAGVELVPVGREQGADDRRRLVRHLAQRVAREVGPGVLVRGALGRGRPAAEVDALDAHPLHRDGLPGRVGAEGRDALPLRRRARAAARRTPRPRRGRPCSRADRAALLDHLAGRVDALDPFEPRAREPAAQLCDLSVEVHVVALLGVVPRGRAPERVGPNVSFTSAAPPRRRPGRRTALRYFAGAWPVRPPRGSSPECRSGFSSRSNPSKAGLAGSEFSTSETPGVRSGPRRTGHGRPDGWRGGGRRR